MATFQKTMLAHPARRFLGQYPLLILSIKDRARSVSSPGGIAAQYRATTIPPGETFS
ncbi:hypothetical protein JW879_03320 [candidate division WOR-3 bacterium]|nr:hypothetical protein [candidate division WOR-3 bacterium]